MRCKIVLSTFVVFYLLLTSFLALATQLKPTLSGQPQPVGSGEAIHLTLKQAIDLALKANRTLVGSAHNLETQKLSLDIAQSQFDIKLTPSTRAAISDGGERLGAGVSFKKKFTTGPEAAITPGFERSDDEYTGNVGLSLDIPLFRGFGKSVTLDPIYSSRFSIQNAERSHYLSQVNTVLETVSDAYDIIKQRGFVQLSESLVKRLMGHAETARIKEQVGLATQIDVYRAEIRTKDAQNSLALARESLRSAEDRLKILLAIPPEKKIQIEAPLDYTRVQMGEKSAIETAFQNRVELDQAEENIREAKRKAGIAKNNLLPGLNLVMDYERFSSPDAFDQAIGLEDQRWSVNLVASTDWARKAEKASYWQSLINIRNVRLDSETKEDEIKREVRQQLEALGKAEERISIRKDQIHQAKGKLSLSKIKFRHNMADNFDIIEAETELQRARVNLLSVKTDYIVGTYRMRAALGTLIKR